MQVNHIINRLYELIASSPDAYTALVLKKSIEQLGLGEINVVETFNELPALPLGEDGKIFLVEQDEELYVNIDSVWKLITDSEKVQAFSWGENRRGELGLPPSQVVYILPTAIFGKVDWVMLDHGFYHRVGIDSAGKAWGFGWNGYGQISDISLGEIVSPVAVPGNKTWQSISGGVAHTLAIDTSGTAWAWGGNNYGQLGHGDTTARSSPVSVIGGINNWSQVSAGSFHSAGVTSDGNLYTWGWSNYGRLGQGALVDRSSPTTVAGSISNWKQVSCGYEHCAAITDSGEAWGWGRNYHGQVGNGLIFGISSPASVVGGISNWTSISAALQHTMAIREDGTAWGWGSGFYGRIGDGAGGTTKRLSPVSVVGGISNWTQIAAGRAHTLGVTADGKAWAWGSVYNNSLGNDTASESQTSPITVVAPNITWLSVGCNFSSTGLGLKT